MTYNFARQAGTNKQIRQIRKCWRSNQPVNPIPRIIFVPRHAKGQGHEERAKPSNPTHPDAECILTIGHSLEPNIIQRSENDARNISQKLEQPRSKHGARPERRFMEQIQFVLELRQSRLQMFAQKLRNSQRKELSARHQNLQPG